MDCQNCTQNISAQKITHIGFQTQQNCWIVILVSLFFVFGLYKLTRIIVRILAPLSWIPYDLKKRYSSEQIKTWALVTGGSQGIGLAYAEQLAKRNFNIILMSRSLAKLKEAQLSISKVNPKVQVKYFSVDFQKLRTPEQYEQLDQLLKQYDISVLVNNVGVYYTSKYAEIPYENIKRQAVVNMIPVTCLTRMILPRMIQRSKKYNKRSAVINISSGASQSQLSYSANYSATKAYIDLFTRSIEVEYRNQPIDFLSVRPYLVTSTMTRGQHSLLHVTPHQCASGSLYHLGKYSVSYGHLFHRIQGVLIQQLNGKLMNKLACMINKNLAQKYKKLDKQKDK